MIKKILFLIAATASMTVASAQQHDPNNEYLVWTNNVIFQKEKADSVVKDSVNKQEEAKSFIERYFRYQSMCDWKDGMRFMVIPDKKDMVIRTFCDSTGEMVSSMSLRHKILVYKGRSGEGELHERVNFVSEDDGTPYYYELPTATFEEYCFSKFGVPTLAYLGDVDIAKEQLMGKRLLTKRTIYNVDVSTTSYGAEKIDVPENTEVTVVAVGVGTRNYPVKIIVADENGHEFFQTVAISRTNSGLADNEFLDDDVLKHTFDGSFELIGDKLADDVQFEKYIGMRLFTIRRVEMENEKGGVTVMPRLTGLKVVKASRASSSQNVRMVFEKDGLKYKKEVSFINPGGGSDEFGNGNAFSDDIYFYHLFRSGNVGSIEGVRQENLPNIRRSIVHGGFNETEVKLALGEPDSKVNTSSGEYMWIYNSGISGKNTTVVFDNSSKKVKYLK